MPLQPEDAAQLLFDFVLVLAVEIEDDVEAHEFAFLVDIERVDLQDVLHAERMAVEELAHGDDLGVFRVDGVESEIHEDAVLFEDADVQRFRDDIGVFDGHRVLEFEVHIADEDVGSVVVEDEVVGAVDPFRVQDLLHDLVGELDARTVAEEFRDDVE